MKHRMGCDRRLFKRDHLARYVISSFVSWSDDQRAIDDTSLSEANSINFASRKCLAFVDQTRDKYFIRKQQNTRFYNFNYSNENTR